MRYSLAVFVAKLAAGTIRRLKLGGGTSFPGQLANQIDPACLSELNRRLPLGSIVITGTNGKTTTAALISAVLEENRIKVVHNKTGANLLPGITASFLKSTDLFGHLHQDCAVIEADEAAFPLLCQAITPKIVIVTNFFRDQLDRFGELDKTVSFIRRGLTALPAGTTVFLNGDDPIVVGLAGVQGLDYHYFGIDDEKFGRQSMEQTAEGKYCPRCGAMLTYERYYYAHLGIYHCPACAFERPPLDLFATKIRLKGLLGSEFSIQNAAGRAVPVEFQLPGLYNVYNALAAWCAVEKMQIPPQRLAAGIAAFRHAFGRMERLEVAGRSVIMALVKNPTGCNEVIRTFLQQEGQLHLLLALNDNYADGTDISWIWDVDYEQLQTAADRLASLTFSGSRAFDMALRLKYAGLSLEKEQVIPDLATALAAAVQLTPVGEMLLIMPNYTSMLGLRSILAEQGYVQQYWEE
ncbi:MAG: Mur ligase family protein [Negativicutes bacterium]|nr:Mur ligase family protein [Negativicutes bacterium]